MADGRRVQSEAALLDQRDAGPNMREERAAAAESSSAVRVNCKSVTSARERAARHRDKQTCRVDVARAARAGVSCTSRCVVEDVP
jgi:hypothetical protein